MSALPPPAKDAVCVVWRDPTTGIFVDAWDGWYWKLEEALTDGVGVMFQENRKPWTQPDHARFRRCTQTGHDGVQCDFIEGHLNDCRF